MKKLFLLLLTACALPDVAPTKTPDKIIDVKNSDCAKYEFKNRGHAPLAFLEGMVQSYKKHCHDAVRPLGSSKDALVQYKLEATQLNVYTLLIGLGMRESTGKYCEGYDVSAGPEKPSEAESGMFQFSYNSKNADSELPKLIGKYQESPSECMLETFSQNVKCKPQSIRGLADSQEGKFQTLGKSCPAFAVDYTAILIRVLENHFGPLLRHEAEFVPACKKLLESACESN